MDYGHYIEIKNAILEAFNTRRDEIAREQFGTSFPRQPTSISLDANAAEVRDYVLMNCPANILEPTSERGEEGAGVS